MAKKKRKRDRQPDVDVVAAVFDQMLADGLDPGDLEKLRRDVRDVLAGLAEAGALATDDGEFYRSTDRMPETAEALHYLLHQTRGCPAGASSLQERGDRS